MESTGTELQSVMRLLDDENPTVRAAVKRKLASYGAGLAAAIEREAPDTSRELRHRARELQRDFEDDQIQKTWESWLLRPDDLEKLERGLILLSDHFVAPGEGTLPVADQLDRLAGQFGEAFEEPDFRTLAKFLFHGKQAFRGDVERYYHPDNSLLARVLERRRGNPISLASVYMLVGKRLGLEIDGCNYPAHFLARAISPSDGQLYLVDCFNEGQVIPSEDLIRHHPLASHEVRDVVHFPASTETVLSRVLRNLETAFGQQNLPAEQALARRLRQKMAEHDAL